MTAPLADREDTRFVEDVYASRVRSGELPLGDANAEHPGVVVATYGDAAWIDRDLAELVYLLWRVGVRTDESCQDVYDTPDTPWAVLGFEAARDARQFLDLAVPVDNEPGGLCDRATGSNVQPENSSTWSWSLFPHVGDDFRYHFGPGVVFPMADVLALTANLRARLLP